MELLKLVGLLVTVVEILSAKQPLLLEMMLPLQPCLDLKCLPAFATELSRIHFSSIGTSVFLSSTHPELMFEPDCSIDFENCLLSDCLEMLNGSKLWMVLQDWSFVDVLPMELLLTGPMKMWSDDDVVKMWPSPSLVLSNLELLRDSSDVELEFAA